MALRDLLGQVNPYVNIFVQAANRIVANPEEEIRVVITAGRNHGEEVDPRRYNAPLADEVAMILPGKPGEVGNRDVIVQRQYGGGLLWMNELAPSYDPLQYPVLFLAGEDGWSDGLPLQNNEAGMRQRVTMVAFYGQRLHFTRELNALHYGGRLFQQYIVDVAAKTEQNALNFLVHNQVKLRAELYQGVQDMLAQDAVLNAAQVGCRIVLPATFHGSLRFMMQAYQDAMAIFRSLGIPDVSLTFTCNPSWPEIQSELLEGQTTTDRPDLVAWVFQMKMKKLLRGVCKAGWLAQVIGSIWTREYKKCGLPHIHLLLIFPWAQKVTNMDDIDRLVSAELPAIENVELYETVTKCLLHGPCELRYPNARCMVNGMCKKRYPHEYSEATTQGEDGYAVYRRHNDGRYLSGAEVVDFLLSFKKHTEWPPVTWLVVHLPGQHNVVFNEDDDLEVVAQRTANQQIILTGYFVYNAANKGSRHVLYTDFPQQHVWKARKKRWAPRQRGAEAVRRMYFVPVASRERFYLRLLLTI